MSANALVSVLVDSREPAAIQRLPFGGVPVSTLALDAGDVWALCEDGALLVIERKTPSDLLNTLRQQRLFPQLNGMLLYSRWVYLLICGDLQAGANDTCWTDGRETGWAWSAVQGALLTAQEIGVHVVFCNGLLDFEPAVLRLARRARGPVPIAPVRDISLISEQEALLAAIPGIGPERAAALLGAEACPTLAWALHRLTAHSAGHDTGGHIAGIGPKTRARCREFFGLRDDEELSPVVRHNDRTDTEGTHDH